jgi:ABC-type transport system involved in multi-copper enzyme maturation permease subunit
MGAWTMASITFREAARKRFLWIALVAGFAFLLLFGTGLHFQVKSLARTNLLLRRQVLNGMLMVGLYAADLLTVVMTVLISVDTLSGEIASGTIHAIATKPIRRSEILLGKWLGFVGMLAIYAAIMVGGVSGVTYILSGATPRHLLLGSGLILLESILLLNLTFLCGTTFSTLTNGVLVLGLHGLAFLGGWIEQAGALAHSPRAMDVGVIASLIMPSESFWRRAAFEMQSHLIGAIGLSPFSNASVPSRAMMVYAALYLIIALLGALHCFRQKDL